MTVASHDTVTATIDVSKDYYLFKLIMEKIGGVEE